MKERENVMLKLNVNKKRNRLLNSIWSLILILCMVTSSYADVLASKGTENVAEVTTQAVNTGTESEGETGLLGKIKAFFAGQTNISGRAGLSLFRDENSLPESITVILYQNGHKFDELTVTSETNWYYEFTGLPERDENYKKYIYTIEETPLDEWTTDYDGYDIINTALPKVEVRVTKIWHDNGLSNLEDQYPDGVQINLYQDGALYDFKTITAEDDWKCVFADLPKHDNKFHDYTYTVKETTTGNWDVVYSTADRSIDDVIGYTITNNFYEVGKLELYKEWDTSILSSGNSQFNEVIYPDVKVRLLRDGSRYGNETYTLGKDNKWSLTIEDIRLTDENGRSYKWSLEEVTSTATTIGEAIPDGVWKVTGDGLTIRNTLTKNTMPISVTKSWTNYSVGGKDIRPEKITFYLWQNGTKVAEKTVAVGTAESASYTFDNTWPIYDSKGDKYEYEITEKPVDDFETAVGNFDYKNYKCTVTNTGNLMEIKVQKSWENYGEYEDHGNVRPAQITFRLKQNNVEVKELTVVIDGSTPATETYSLGNWPIRNENGATYTYTLSEDSIEGFYTGSIETSTSNNVRTFSLTNWGENYPEEPEPCYCYDDYQSNTESFIIRKVWEDDGSHGAPVVVSVQSSNGSSWRYTLTDTNFSARRIDENTMEWTFYFETYMVGYRNHGECAHSEYCGCGENCWGGTDIFWENWITYEVKEEDVSYYGYTSDTTDYVEFSPESRVTITNTKEEEPDEPCRCDNCEVGYEWQSAEYTITKKWEDDGSHDAPVVVWVRSSSGSVEKYTLTENDLNVTKKDDNTTEWTFDWDTYETCFKYHYACSETCECGHCGYKEELDGSTETYEVKEEDVSSHGYTSDTTDYVEFDSNNRSVTITNTMESPEEWDTETKTAYGDFRVIKKWADYDNELKLRPTSVKVDIYRITTTDVGTEKEEISEPELYDTVTVRLRDDGTWYYEWERLPAYEFLTSNRGNTLTTTTYSYYVEEHPITLVSDDYSYTSTKTDFAYNKGLDCYVSTITNTFAVVDNGEVSGSKIWIGDRNNVYKLRADSVEVAVYAILSDNTQVLLEKKTVNAENNWSYHFTNLKKSYVKNGVSYLVTDYLVKEVKVPDNYTVSYPEGTYDIKNTIKPEALLTEYEVDVTWQDDVKGGDVRPDEIILDLYADGVVVDTITLPVDDSDDPLTHKWDELPKYDITTGEEIIYYVREREVDGYTTTHDDSKDGSSTSIVNTIISREVTISGKKYWRDDSGELKGTKTWVDHENAAGLRPEKITVHVLLNGEVYDSQEVTGADGWTYHFKNLPKYDDNNERYTYSITEDAIDGYSTIIYGKNITNVLYGVDPVTTIDVKGIKTWADNNDAAGLRPEEITVTLLRNGEPQGSLQVTEADGWVYNWKNLPKYDSEGKEYAYTVEETAVKGYKATVTGYNIKNTLLEFVDETVDINGIKTWVDHDDSLRPGSIFVSLFQNEKLYGTKEVTSEYNWSYSWLEMPRYDSDGNAYVYRIEEAPVAGYVTSYDGYNITNTVEKTNTNDITKVDVNGIKTWVDGNNASGDRPGSIAVILYQNGVLYEDAEALIADGSNQWSYSWTELPKYDEKGQFYRYTIKEDDVQGYESTITNGYNITNTLTDIEPTTIDVNGVKTWEDQNNIAGTRPESITVKLLRNGEAYQEQSVDAGSNWSYTWTGLDKYDLSGAEYIYTIEEAEVEGYVSSVRGYNLTNTLITEDPSTTVDVNGIKTWVDNDDETGRPESITVSLYQNGKLHDTKEVKSDRNWSYTWTKLPKYDSAGNIYEYTIKEEPVENYKTTMNGYSIINTRDDIDTPVTIDVNGIKTWVDQNNYAGLRPDEIIIKLLRNGQVLVTKTQAVDSSSNYSWSFTKLPYADAAGEPYDYSVEEVAVDSYTTTYDGYCITNTYTDMEPTFTVDVNGIKTWVDNGDASGDRPDAIKVFLFRDGKQYDSKTVTSEANWSYSFSALPKYDSNKKEYAYTVIEETIDGYSTAVNGYDLTNTFKGIDPKATVDVDVVKTWVDQNNNTGKRPVSITVNLLRNDTVIETQEVTGATNWICSWTDLPKYDDELAAYRYTVTEEPVDGYQTEIDGYNIRNILLQLVTMDIDGSKTWVMNAGSGDVIPDSITINLLQNGRVLNTKEVTSADDWKYSWNLLPKYDSYGDEYVYTIEETAVDGYDTTIDGYDITNTATKDEPEISKTVEGKSHLVLTNREDSFDWIITASFNNTAAEWETASIVDELNELLEIKSVTVRDADGTDVSSKGTLTTDDNKVVFALDKEDGSYVYLSGQTYTVTITSKIREGVTDEQLLPYIQTAGIPNQAVLMFGDGNQTVVTEIPKVTPPSEEPGIGKTVNGKNHEDLASRDEAFNWIITTDFGTATNDWDKAVISDKINDVLKIESVTIEDAEGNDVSANGTLTTDGNNLIFELAKQDDSYAYLSGQTYTITVESRIKAEVTDAELAPFIEDGGIPNQAKLTFGDGSKFVESEIPTVTPPTEEPEIGKTVNGKNHEDLSNRDETFNWIITTSFGNATANWDKAAITDKINDVLDIELVTIKDAEGNNVSGNGTLTTDGNNLVFELAKQDDSYAYLSGQTYTITVESKIKAGVTDAQLAPFIEDGGIPNQAKLTFGDGSKFVESEIPTVTPPTEAPEEPEIGKTVNSKSHEDLANRDETFNWIIKTDFGTGTADWDKAAITDKINDVLDIESVTIKDAKGNDVKENGTLTTNGNNVVFELAKQEDSYAYLAGQTYTITVESKIKADVTDAQLAPFIEDGGIPNQAKLTFGDGSKFVESEIPTVTPPTEAPEEPEIGKTVEGKSHLVLANRGDSFEWIITASFGNTAAEWEKASIEDELNELLEIEAVTVKDANETDVSSKGTLTTDANKVVFALDKEEGSYAYLSGQTYTITITSKIRSDATVEQLLPYIRATGIPNQAKLTFGDGSEFVESGIPTVTPPIETPEEPEIGKTIEGKSHLVLANRGDSFDWIITASFGNTTAGWEKASIVDELNELLEIETVTIQDANGTDVSSKGTLTTNDNKVVFDLDKEDGSYAYLAGQTFTITITSKLREDATEEQLLPYIITAGIPNQAVLMFGDGNQTIESEVPKVTLPSEEPGIGKTVNGKSHEDLVNRDEIFNWIITTDFGIGTADWDKATISDKINDVLDILSVTIKDAQGNNVSGNGTLTTNGNNIVFELAKQNGSYAYLAGQTYTITVESRVKAEVTDTQLAPYIEAGGIPNQAKLTFGDGSKFVESEIPTVTPPIVTPEEPEIGKTVNGKSHEELANRDETFNWIITTSFGNTTVDWDKATISDKINDVLAILSVTVKDAQGNDVSGNGTLSTNGNNLFFELAKQDGSYAYLTGQTYTITVQSRIKADVTNIELGTFIRNGGIPNQATLTFGAGGELNALDSEIPTVMTPLVSPGIEKTIEGEGDLELSNRDDSFEWIITTDFGNNTYSWSVAEINDQVNELLEILEITIVDEEGNDVSGNGTLSTTNNKLVFTLSKQDGSYGYLSGHIYTIYLTTRIKDDITDEELMPYIKAGGIPNQATLVFGDGESMLYTESSDIPTVTVPLEDPTIKKTVNGKKHLDLSSLNNSFDWIITVSFGNATSSWNEAVISDQINSLLEIQKVVIEDEDGNDVSENGTLSTKGNKVKFVLTAEDGGYGYLSGHTYTMTITTKIKSSATEAELAPYRKNGGIPNRAKLVYGSNGDTVKSGKPTVTPPDKDTPVAIPKTPGSNPTQTPQSAAKTGDNTNILIYFLGLASIFIVFALIMYRRKKKACR